MVLHGFLLLIVVDNQNIANGKENITSIEHVECNEENISHWLWYHRGSVNKTGIKCNVQCSTKCTCTLDDVNVTRNCTSDNVAVCPVIYPSNNTKYLNWDNSVLHNIKPGAFWRFGSALESLHLTNISLQLLQPGVFSRLSGVTYLDLSLNQLQNILSGSLRELVNLTRLNLEGNILTEIRAGAFTGLIRLEVLYLMNNELNRIAEGTFEDLVELKELVLSVNYLSEIRVGVFRGLIRLETLHLNRNRLNKIAEGAFENLGKLELLRLDDNNLSEINAGVLRGLVRLGILDLSSNRLNRISEGTFEDLEELQVLSLNDNMLSTIELGVFTVLKRLTHLNLIGNRLNRIPNGAFVDLEKLEQFDLRDNPLLWIEEHALNTFNGTVILVVSEYATCCFTTANCSSSSPSPYLTCKRLLPYDLLRIAIWFVCSFAIVGNIFVLCTRLKDTRQRGNVQVSLITNLSISDFLMGIYLIILLSADLYYTEYFPSHSELWRHSMLCRVAGAISVLSSEASAFFITLISIDRFLGIKYTFSKFRLGSKSTRITVTLLWMIALSISITVFVLSKEDSEIYAVSEICVGLPITRAHIYSKEDVFLEYTYYASWRSETHVKTGSSVGMFFSISLFTGLNLVCFFIIGYCYVAIFIYVKQTTKQSGRSRNLNEEIRMAIKMSLIVFTDFCCWVPIGVLSILVQGGAVEVHPVSYAWIATFVLPINSSLNPFLYTLASCL